MVRFIVAACVVLASSGLEAFGGDASKYLEPIPPYRADTYEEDVFKLLVGGNSAELWMLVMPSRHEPEHALILYSEPIPPATDDLGWGEPRRWFLEEASASQRIWSWDQNSKTAGFHYGQGVEVHRSRLEVTPQFGGAIKKAWLVAVRKTRYSDSALVVRDGVLYQFFCNGKYGEARSPEEGLPTQLVDLGNRLALLVKAAPTEQKAQMQDDLAKAAALEQAALASP